MILLMAKTLHQLRLVVYPTIYDGLMIHPVGEMWRFERSSVMTPKPKLHARIFFRKKIPDKITRITFKHQVWFPPKMGLIYYLFIHLFMYVFIYIYIYVYEYKNPWVTKLLMGPLHQFEQLFVPKLGILGQSFYTQNHIHRKGPFFKGRWFLTKGIVQFLPLHLFIK